MRSIAWWHIQWPWRTPNPVFKVTAFLKSNIRKRRVLKTVIIAQEETIPSIWNGTICLLTTTGLNASRGFVSISWASCSKWWNWEAAMFQINYSYLNLNPTLHTVHQHVFISIRTKTLLRLMTIYSIKSYKVPLQDHQYTTAYAKTPNKAYSPF